MFSIRNVEEYLKDNPDRFPNPKEILAKAKGFLEEGSDELTWFTALVIFGPDEGECFLCTITRDIKHLNIFLGGSPDSSTEKFEVLCEVLKTLEDLSEKGKITILAVQ